MKMGSNDALFFASFISLSALMSPPITCKCSSSLSIFASSSGNIYLLIVPIVYMQVLGQTTPPSATPLPALSSPPPLKQASPPVKTYPPPSPVPVPVKAPPSTPPSAPVSRQDATPISAHTPSVPGQEIPSATVNPECAPPCKVRCAKHSRQNVCLRACTTCCLRCKCVPPGQYGNKEMCGSCYANMTTRGGRPKCP
ncbi:hypothetical protein DM860_005149 [Cuscuta australis]|uniref:Gibberellin regulated protein n=1 Tax=Cuscuta australis TaxID=267555 RepID=A0A328DNN5_9ASTE|nr:hypothetical protein DM860_005149 [Cuscuta australis]